MQEEIKNIWTINISVTKKQKARRHCEEPKGFGDEAIQPILHFANKLIIRHNKKN